MSEDEIQVKSHTRRKPAKREGDIVSEAPKQGDKIVDAEKALQTSISDVQVRKVNATILGGPTKQNQGVKIVSRNT